MIPDQDSTKIRSPWYEWTEDGVKQRLQVRYGWSKHGWDQYLYFSITGTHQGFISAGEDGNLGRWSTISVGCLHEMIEKHAPDLAPLIPFHLFYAESGPLHYSENAIYAWRQIVGEEPTATYSKPHLVFASAICWGALTRDDECGQGPQSIADTMRTIYEAVGQEEATKWINAFLLERKPLLMVRFREVMRKYDCLDQDDRLLYPASIEEIPPIEKFAKEHGISFTAEDDYSGSRAGWGEGAQHFKCVIRKGRKSMQTHFAMGSAHTLGPTITEVLSSILNDIDSIDNAGDFETWVRDLGLSDDMKQARSWYRSIVKSEESLRRVLGDKLFEVLRNGVDREE